MPEHLFHVGYQGSSVAKLDVDEPDDWDADVLARELDGNAQAKRNARTLVTLWVSEVVHHDDCFCRGVARA